MKVAPVLSYISQVILDNWPYNISGGGIVTIVQQPLGVRNHSSCSQGRPVSLRPTPSPGELGLVGVKLGFTKTRAIC